MDSIESVLEVANAEDRYRSSFNSIYTAETRESVEVKVVDLSEDANLDKREQQVLASWLENGIRFDTSLWMQTLKTHWGDNEYLDRREIATALFIDIYNRADDVFDEFRQQHVGSDGNITTQNLETLPILKCSDNTTASVGEMMTVLKKIVNDSGEYSIDEQQTINQNIEKFLSISTEAIRQYENVPPNVITYGLDKALALRYQTLNPLVLLANDIYQREGTSSKDNSRIRNEMVALAIAVQWLDDRNDWEEDLEKGNVNLVLGVFADHVNENNEIFQNVTRYDLKGVIEAVNGEEFDDETSQTVNELSGEINSNYQQYYSQVHPDQKQFLPDEISL